MKSFRNEAPPRQKYPKQFKILVRKYVKEYRRILYADELHGDLAYMDYDNTDVDPGSNVNAEIHVDLKYLTYKIKLYPALLRMWKVQGDEALERVIAHEMSHIITEPAKNLIFQAYRSPEEVRQVWESLTEKIARLALSMPKAKKKK